MKLLRCVCYIRPFVFATGEVLAFAPRQVLVRIRQHGLCRAQKEGPSGVMVHGPKGDSYYAATTWMRGRWVNSGELSRVGEMCLQ